MKAFCWKSSACETNICRIIAFRKKRQSDRKRATNRVGEWIESQAKRLLNCSISLNECLKFPYHTCKPLPCIVYSKHHTTWSVTYSTINTGKVNKWNKYNYLMAVGSLFSIINITFYRIYKTSFHRTQQQIDVVYNACIYYLCKHTGSYTFFLLISNLSEQIKDKSEALFSSKFLISKNERKTCGGWRMAVVPLSSIFMVCRRLVIWPGVANSKQ